VREVAAEDIFPKDGEAHFYVPLRGKEQVLVRDTRRFVHLKL
jgi:hypothetical protein